MQLKRRTRANFRVHARIWQYPLCRIIDTVSTIILGLTVLKHTSNQDTFYFFPHKNTSKFQSSSKKNFLATSECIKVTDIALFLNTIIFITQMTPHLFLICIWQILWSKAFVNWFLGLWSNRCATFRAIIKLEQLALLSPNSKFI